MAVQSPVPPTREFGDLSFQSQWASLALQDGIERFQKGVRGLTKDKLALSWGTSRPEDSPGARRPKFKVGIIGAGVSGLFTAMTLDYLNEKYRDYGLDVEYEIIEANGEERLGGRLYTHHFKDKEDGDEDVPSVGPHDYYDVGAMRFPNSPVMARTFALFDKLGMKFNNQRCLREKMCHTPKNGDLVPYYFSDKHQPALYNSKWVPNNPPLTANNFNIPLPKEVANLTPDQLIRPFIQKYIDVYEKQGPAEFWTELIKDDACSVRQFLYDKAGYDYDTVEFMEMMDSGSRWYDQAWTEAVIDTLEFDPTATWWCVEGGSQVIAHLMRDKLKQKKSIKYNQRVLAMEYVDKTQEKINVTIRGDEKKRTFDAVFNSAPLGAMQQMDLEGLELNWGTKQAIRSLGYGASCKIGVRFKTLWWTRPELGIDHGGQGKTDLPISCCVYPSYNVHDDKDKPGVLLVSYTWGQQAERIGSLISRETPEKEDELKLVVLHDLARLHSSEKKGYKKMVKIIEDEYLDHHAYNWHADPTSVGAFAYFGPGQFRHMWPEIIKSNGKHMIIGEATSGHHAWVVGALESATRGVYQFLYRHAEKSTAAQLAAWTYEHDEEITEENKKITMPFGPLPPEYDRLRHNPIIRETRERIGTFDNAAANASTPTHGEMIRQEIMIESIRLKQKVDRVDPTKVESKDVAPFLRVEA